MEDYFVMMGLAIIFGTLKQVVKNPGSKKHLDAAFIKLRDQLLLAYPLDDSGTK